MMNGDSELRIEELARQKLEGKSYSKIRGELRASGMQEEELGRLMKQVDDRVLQVTLEQGAQQARSQYYRWGLFLAVAGLILSIVYNAGLVLNGLPALVVYAPFLSGIVLMFYGKRVRNMKPASPSRDPGPIRKKRPYK